MDLLAHYKNRLKQDRESSLITDKVLEFSRSLCTLLTGDSMG